MNTLVKGSVKRMASYSLKVTICGRPNVGKSTLFNRLVRRGIRAVVDKRSGITRDRKYGLVEWCGRRFILIDSGGFEVDGDGIISKVRDQTKIAINEANLILFMVDFKDGLLKGDLDLANYLRRAKARVILVVNKVDHKGAEGFDLSEYYGLGFGEPVPISALHGINIDMLLDLIIEDLAPSSIEGEREKIRVAIVGRPNVGKSSLLNRILGEERVVVDEAPGTTRDPIDTPFEYKGKNLIFIDTAGIRRKVKEGIEKVFIDRAIESMGRADVALLLVEAPTGIVNTDKRIIGIMEELGCGGILVVNKWDLAKDINKEDYRRWILERIPFSRYLPLCFISAMTGEGIPQLLNLLIEVAKRYKFKVSTPRFNHLIQRAFRQHTPPVYKGREVRVYYGTQKATSPPTFLLFANYPAGINLSYLRYLETKIREEFDLVGIPIRFEVRKKV